MVALGSAFLGIWFLGLAVFHASGNGFHLMLLVPILAFFARFWHHERTRT